MNMLTKLKGFFALPGDEDKINPSELSKALELHKIFLFTGGRSGKKLNLRYKDLSNMDLSGQDLRQVIIRDSKLDGVNLAGTRLSKSDLSGSSAIGAIFSNADCSAATLLNVDFGFANLTNTNFTRADLRSTNHSGTDMRNAKLQGAYFRHARMEKVVLPRNTFIIDSEPFHITIVEGKSATVDGIGHSIEEWFNLTEDHPSYLRLYGRYEKLLDLISFYVPDHGFERPGWLLLANKPSKEDEVRRVDVKVDGKYTQSVRTLSDISDGYHTFNELYEFRKLCMAGLFNEWFKQGKNNVMKSKRHYDGELCFGGEWFVVYAITPYGQISAHHSLKDWDLFTCDEVPLAPEYDGHTSKDVLKTLQMTLGQW